MKAPSSSTPQCSLKRKQQTNKQSGGRTPSYATVHDYLCGLLLYVHVYPQESYVGALVPFLLCKNSGSLFSFRTFCIISEESWEYCIASWEQNPNRVNFRFTSSLSSLQPFCKAWSASCSAPRRCCLSSTHGTSSRRCCEGESVHSECPSEDTCFSLSLRSRPVNMCTIR